MTAAMGVRLDLKTWRKERSMRGSGGRTSQITKGWAMDYTGMLECLHGRPARTDLGRSPPEEEQRGCGGLDPRAGTACGRHVRDDPRRGGCGAGSDPDRREAEPRGDLLLLWRGPS